LAGGLRSLEQRSKRRAQAPVEVGGKVVERRIARVQRLREPAFGADERRVALHPAREGLERVASGRQRGRGVRASVYLALEDGGDEVRALRKMAVEGAKPNASLLGDLAHRRIDAGGGEHVLCGLQQRVEAALGVGAHALRRGAFRPDGLLELRRRLGHDKSVAKRNGVPY